MRHINRVRGFYQYPKGEPRLEPYFQLNFRLFKTRPNKTRTWAKILQFIANNPGCKRRDVLFGIGAANADNDRTWRGQQSCVFANLLHQDLIDYNEHYAYFVTQAGINKLMTLGFQLKWM